LKLHDKQPISDHQVPNSFQHLLAHQHELDPQ
jgi:hypothetical protein